MLDIPKAQDFLRAVAAARISGDIDALMSCFHDDVALRIVGVGAVAEGRDAVRAAVEGLTREFEFLEWRVLDLVVQDESIAVRQHLKVRHRSSGRVAETETAEFLKMTDGRCSAFTQFADTALIAKLSATT